MAKKVKHQSAETRQKLIESAAYYFGKYPVKKIKYQWIANHAGYKFKTFYRYFRNKNDVFAVVVAAEIASCTKFISEDVEMQSSASEKLHIFFRVRFQCCKRLMKYRFLNRDVILKITEAIFALAKFDSWQSDLLARIIEEGQSRGEFVSGNAVSIAETMFFAIEACDRVYFDDGMTDDEYLLKTIYLAGLFSDSISK